MLLSVFVCVCVFVGFSRFSPSFVSNYVMSSMAVYLRIHILYLFPVRERRKVFENCLRNVCVVPIESNNGMVAHASMQKQNKTYTLEIVVSVCVCAVFI